MVRNRITLYAHIFLLLERDKSQEQKFLYTAVLVDSKEKEKQHKFQQYHVKISISGLGFL
jgi:hypothetical protein